MSSASPRRGPALGEPTYPATPWYMYLIGVAGAVVVGGAAAYPKAFLLLLFLGPATALILGALRNSWIALALIVAQYPLLNVLRTLYVAHDLPVFTGGVRFLPDFFQMVILGQILILAIRDPRRRPQIFGDDLPVLVYILVGIYSVVIASQHVHPLGPLNGWHLSMTPALFYFVIRWLRPTEEQSRWFCRWMGRCAGVLLCLSFPVYYFKPDWYKVLQHAEHPHFVPPGMSLFDFWGFYPRMQGVLFDELVWGTFCGMSAILAIAQVGTDRNPVKQYLFILMSVVGMLCSLSRGALASFGVGIVVLLCLRGTHRRRLLGVVAAFFLLVSVGTHILRDKPIVTAAFSRLDTVSMAAAEKGEVANDRTHQWKSGWEIFLQMPSGMGLGTVGYGAALSKVTTYLVGDGMYFRILSEQGVPGFLAFLYLILSVFWILWRYRNIAPPQWRPLGAGLLAFHSGLCVHAVFANTFDYYGITAIYFMLLGIYVSAVHRHLGEVRTAATVATPSPSPVGSVKFLEAYRAR